MKIKEQWKIENAYDIELLKAYNRQMDTIRMKGLERAYKCLHEVESLIDKFEIDRNHIIVDTMRRWKVTRDTFDRGYYSWIVRIKE